MSLKPLGSRLIIRPESAATESAGGIVFPETYGAPPAMTGTVVSVGRGPATAHRVRGETIAHCMGLVEETARQVPSTALASAVMDALASYAMEQVAFSEVQEGQYVCFAYTAGHAMQVDGESLIVIDEGDLQAVWTPETQESAA